MAVAVDRALLETQYAFDGVADSYDAANTANPLLREMRRQALAMLAACVTRGSHVLDLGCGPGTDLEAIGRLGCTVTAIDWSPAMIEQARQRVRAARLEPAVEVRHLGIQQLDRLAPSAFDVAYSNFGPLNCVPDLRATATMIADRLRPGGVLVASVIGRVCPWEIGCYALRGNWRRLRIRFARDLVAVPLEGQTVWMRYETPGRFAAAFTHAGFRRRSLRALGLFAPPPYLQAFSERHRTLVAGLQWLDARLGACPGLRAWGDHFLIVLEKT